MKAANRRFLYIAVFIVVIFSLLFSHWDNARKDRIASWQFKEVCENFPRISHEDLETAKNLAKKIVSDGLDPSDSGSYYIRPLKQQGEIYYTPLRFWRMHIDNLYLENREIIYNGKFYFYSKEIIMFKKK